MIGIEEARPSEIVPVKGTMTAYDSGCSSKNHLLLDPGPRPPWPPQKFDEILEVMIHKAASIPGDIVEMLPLPEPFQYGHCFITSFRSPTKPKVNSDSISVDLSHHRIISACRSGKNIDQGRRALSEDGAGVHRCCA